ncbi:MAG: alanine--tRNA ligase [Mariprofundaceae bacterium]
MKAAEIRARFLEYFAGKGHETVASSPLVPFGDPSLLFTNAGMVQFKKVFTGQETLPFVRAASSQKCVRAGGKHNDLENVGRTARHHTFFEMLGNFSFGDYFKREAIEYAWEFLTRDLGIDPERLFVTVFDEDDEAADIWLNQIGVSEARFARIGAADNFWSMGETGPCGPCSEIFYDHGPDVEGGPPGTPEAEGDRFVEIWNLVFMQYDRDEAGSLTPLPKPSVDTGMGLERIAAVMQGMHNNYDIDLFQMLIHAAADLAGVRYGKEAKTDVSLRIIADHLRAISFLIGDGVLPSNEGRGYVLRRILRRAARHGRLLGMQGTFLHKLAGVLVEEMSGHYHELSDQQANIEQIVRIEEERFNRTLDNGLKLLGKAVDEAGAGGVIPGETVFTLYDTFGFPVDLTEDILSSTDISLDLDGFEHCMAQQRQRARAAWVGSGERSVPPAIFELREQKGATEFLGYAATEAEGAISALILGEASVDVLEESAEGVLLANQTPFYGESGGQVGDAGIIETADGRFEVSDTQKPLMDLHVHKGRVVKGRIKVGSVGHFVVNAARRDNIRRCHTATHLLHATLRQVLGDHVKQAGSLVTPDRLRFDFNHFQPLSEDEKISIEAGVNAAILVNESVMTEIMGQQEAIDAGAMALFGEKYADEVRVVRAGPISTELCGGTHVARLGDIGLFRLISETGIAAGVRRLEAVVGADAYKQVQEQGQVLQEIANALKATPAQAVERIGQLQERLKDVEKKLQSAQGKQGSARIDELMPQVQDVAGVQLLVAELGPEVSDLRDFLDKAKAKLKSGVIVFGLKRGDKAQLIAGVTKDLTGRFHAGNIVREVAVIVGGKGGGRPDMAQAGGTEPGKLSEALASVLHIVEGGGA